MQRRDRERWKELCKEAGAENDPVKLRELVREINRLETKAPKSHDDRREFPSLRTEYGMAVTSSEHTAPMNESRISSRTKIHLKDSHGRRTV